MGYLVRKPIIIRVLIHGDKSSYQAQRQYHRYYLVITTALRKGLSVQDLACCDYFRTPVIFEGSDIYRFVGVIHDQAYVKCWNGQSGRPALRRALT